MDLKIKMDMASEIKDQQRVHEAINKKKEAAYVPTWDEVWVSGYKTSTGRLKDGILNTKLTDLDKSRLLEVKKAIEQGEIGTNIKDIKKFTKTHALNIYKLLVEQRKDKTIKKMIEEKPDNYVLVLEEEQLLKLSEDLSNEDIIGLDTETTGVDLERDRVVGISITLPKSNYHVYIPIRHMVEVEQLNDTYVLQILKPHLENEDLKKVLHNAKFDVHMLRHDDVYVSGIFMDTMVAMTILNENEPTYALKNLATKYGKHFGFDDKSTTYEELFGKGGFQNTPLDIATVYACKDTHLTYEFHKWILSHMERVPQLKKVYFEVEKPILEVCIDMEKNGFLVDLEYAKEYQIKLKGEIESLSKKLYEYFGDINLNSPVQLAEKLYDDFKLDDPSGNRSVDAYTLKILEDKHQGISTLLKYRELNKLLTTYIEPMPEKVSIDGRLHGQFNQSDTVTGRFASRNPNLQNIPEDARKLIVAPKGKFIIGSDYSQIEPRILAHISEDDDFKYPYLTGQDLYTTLASKTFSKPMEECMDGSKERKMMKTGLLATMYGTSNFTLASQLDIEIDEAEQFISDFLNSYPKVRAWITSIHEFVDENGYVETLFGRKRRFIGHKENARKYRILKSRIESILGRTFKNIWEEKAVPRKLKLEYWAVAKPYFRVLRQSVNAIIQGTGAEIMKKAMIEVAKYLKSKDSNWMMLATIHDEILIEVPESITREEIEEIEEIMKNAVKLTVPLKVDTDIMTVWSQGIKKDKWLKMGQGRAPFNK